MLGLLVNAVNKLPKLARLLFVRRVKLRERLLLFFKAFALELFVKLLVVVNQLEIAAADKMAQKLCAVLAIAFNKVVALGGVVHNAHEVLND